MDALSQQFADHERSDEHRFDEIREFCKDIKEDTRVARENHWAHVQASTAAIQLDVNSLKEGFTVLSTSVTAQGTDIGWLKQWHWVIITCVVGSLITGLFSAAVLVIRSIK